MILKMRSGALLLWLALGWVAVAQAAEPGWYAIGFGGESSASGNSQREADENLVAIFASVGFEVLDSTSSLDDSDTGFGFGGGYQLNDHFAFEFGYVDLGSVTYESTSTVMDDGGNQAVADLRLESSSQGPVVSVLGFLPIGERFALFGRAGLSLMDAEGRARITLDGVSQRASQSAQKSDPMFGVGAELALTKHSAIRLGWDRYLDVGTENVTGDIDADLYTLAVRFGLAWFR